MTTWTQLEKLKRRPKSVLAGALVLMLGFAFACSDAESEASSVSLRSVSLTIVKAVTLEDRIEASGELLAKVSGRFPARRSPRR